MKVPKFKPYGFFSLIATIVCIGLSAIMKFSLSNTWQGLVALPIIFGPLWVYGWKATTSIKHKYPFLSVFCRFCLINLAIGYVLGVALFF
jgi:hypothetical protein